MVSVVIDVHERRTAVALHLEDDAALDCTFRPLKAGDYLIDGRILVERKTTNDFANSVVSGRMFEQAARLSRATPRAVILVERGPNRSALGRRQLQGAILSITVVFGISVIFSRGPADTAWTLKRLGALCRRRLAKGSATRWHAPADVDEAKVVMLASVPGIGPARAKALLRHFGSLEKILEAPVEELEAASGIGPHLAGRIRRFLTESFKGRS